MKILCPPDNAPPSPRTLGSPPFSFLRETLTLSDQTFSLGRALHKYWPPTQKSGRRHQNLVEAAAWDPIARRRSSSHLGSERLSFRRHTHVQ
jgi:hypothetical protein